MPKPGKRLIPNQFAVSNPKKMTRGQKRRVGRHFGRKAEGKKPLAQPLTMSGKGMIDGNLFLLNGGQELKFPLKNRQGQILQGVYRQGDGKIIVARFAGDMGFLALYELEDAGRENHLKASEGNLLLPTFFSARLDLAHMRIPEPARGHGFGLKMASRVARHAQVNPVRTSIFSGMAWEENWFDIFQKYPRAFGKIYDKFGPVNRKSPEAILKFKRLAWENGLYIFRTGVSKFDNLFKKLGFEMIVDPDGCRIFLKTGKTSKFNDMEKYCKVEAIDPKTGRTREYVFPVG